MLVAAITPINAALFPEYVLPRTAHLARDTDEAVRATYARCLVPLADTAVRFLEMGQALRAHGAFDLRRPETGEDDARFEVGSSAFMRSSALNGGCSRSPMMPAWLTCKPRSSSILRRFSLTPRRA
jgi:hypothetical protein